MPASPHPDEQLAYLRREIDGIRQLLADTRLQTQLVHLRLLRQGHIRHGWLRYVVKDLETNPRTQYKVHFWGAIYWLVNFPLVACLFFFAPSLWTRLGIFITLIYSIYANFATDYGGMSAAMASFGAGALPEIPVETHVPPSGGQGRTSPDGGVQ